MTPLETRYAKSGDIHIAYQVAGSGPLDLVFVPGFILNLDFFWGDPGWVNFLSRLAGFSRLILFDKRGTGLSDRIAGIANLEDRMDNVRAVMDAVNSERAALFGISEGGPMSLLSRRHVSGTGQRLGALRELRTPPRRFQPTISNSTSNLSRDCGEPANTRCVLLPQAGRETRLALHSFARWEGLGARPAAAMSILRMNSEIDARHVLPVIRVPTLSLARADDTRITAEAGRYLAANITGARYVELPGTDHLPPGERDIVDRIIDEAEEFLTGSLSSETERNRVLATVMFTDIVEVDRSAPPSLVTGNGAPCLIGTTTQCGSSSRGLEDMRSKISATGSWRPLTARPAPCAAPPRSHRRCGRSALPSGAASIQGEIELKRDDVVGIAVHMAARIGATAEAGEIFVSRTVRDLVAGSGLLFEDRGVHALRGLPEAIHLFTVRGH